MTEASPDRSEGYDRIAERFIAARSGIGADLVRSWAREHLAPGSAVLDVGCGSGFPIAQALTDDGFALFGIDASPALIAAFRAAFPQAQSACETAQTSAFFHRRFDAAIAIGLIFLLSVDDQCAVIRRIGAALHPGGRFLFSAPRQRCDWNDLLTARHSQSLGERAYRDVLDGAGLSLVGCIIDERGNNYYDSVKFKRLKKTLRADNLL